MDPSREDHLFVNSCMFRKVVLEKQASCKLNKFNCIRIVSTVQRNVQSLQGVY